MARANLHLRPINSVKHVVDIASTAVPAGVVTEMPIADAVDDPAQGSPNQVATGSRISSFYVRVEVIHNSGTWVTQPRMYMIVMKNPGNNLATPFPAGVGTTDLRKFVIHQEMIMVTGIAADDNSFPRTMFVGVIKLPRGYQRFGYDDNLSLAFSLPLAATTATVSVCIQAIYKEYR